LTKIEATAHQSSHHKLLKEDFKSSISVKSSKEDISKVFDEWHALSQTLEPSTRKNFALTIQPLQKNRATMKHSLLRRGYSRKPISKACDRVKISMAFRQELSETENEALESAMAKWRALAKSRKSDVAWKRDVNDTAVPTPEADCGDDVEANTPPEDPYYNDGAFIQPTSADTDS
jgi:hypothetical protein